MTERRKKTRFPLDMPMRFACPDRPGDISRAGRVVDISSSGFAFRSAAESLPNGTKVSAAVEWPVVLEDQCMLQLFVEGAVVRTDDSLTVISIDRYEFRTMGRVGRGGLLTASRELSAQLHGVTSN